MTIGEYNKRKLAITTTKRRISILEREIRERQAKLVLKKGELKQLEKSIKPFQL